MTYLSDDPTYLAGGFLLLAGAFVIALRVTQRGKYLLYAGVFLALALAVVVIEWIWITDSELIEKVIQDVRTAVLNSDADGVLAHLTPDVRYSGSETARSPDETRALIRASVSNTHLEFVRISGLKISVGQKTRQGSAEFRVFARGGLKSSNVTDGGTSVTAWSLGFRETEPGIWKISRISRISIPGGPRVLPTGSML